MTEDVDRHIERLLNSLPDLPAEQRLPFLKEQLKSLSPRDRKIATVYMAMTQNSLEASEKRQDRTDRRVAFATGVAFILLIIVLALFVPNPSAYQYTVFRITLALMAGAFAQAIPGVVEVHLGRWLRATSAAAIFAIVYFFAPAVISEPPRDASTNPAPIESAESR